MVALSNDLLCKIIQYCLQPKKCFKGKPRRIFEGNPFKVEYDEYNEECYSEGYQDSLLNDSEDEDTEGMNEEMMKSHIDNRNQIYKKLCLVDRNIMRISRSIFFEHLDISDKSVRSITLLLNFLQSHIELAQCTQSLFIQSLGSLSFPYAQQDILKIIDICKENITELILDTVPSVRKGFSAKVIGECRQLKRLSWNNPPDYTQFTEIISDLPGVKELCVSIKGPWLPSEHKPRDVILRLSSFHLHLKSKQLISEESLLHLLNNSKTSLKRLYISVPFRYYPSLYIYTPLETIFNLCESSLRILTLVHGVSIKEFRLGEEPELENVEDGMVLVQIPELRYRLKRKGLI